MGRRPLLSLIGIAFAAGALVATAALRIPAPARRAAAEMFGLDADVARDRPGSAAAPVEASSKSSAGAADSDAPTASSEAHPRGTSGRDLDEAERDLRDRMLLLPVEGVSARELTDTFTQSRGSTRQHEALDILAPKRTPVRAVEDGRVVKLFTSKLGGLTIYQFDPSERFCYYYAHLDGYAPGLAEGRPVARGDVIGYVGTTGNAPPETPHLHFAVFLLGPERHWWEGTAIDPYPLFRQ